MNGRGMVLAMGLVWAIVVATRADEEAMEKRAADLAAPVPIMAGDSPIEVEGYAAPFVGDFDGDGKQDLLVGQYGLGRLRIYRNLDSNVQPVFKDFEWFRAGGRVAGVPVCCLVAFTPQLVDFDGDGRSDVLTGSGVEGEVFWYRRLADGSFEDATVLQNREGQVRMHRKSISGLSHHGRRYNVTASAYDWDADGDLDLLLGMSPLCLVVNEGTSRESSFDGGRMIECQGEPIRSSLASAQMADWDGDGRDDLLAGGAGKGIVWYRNVGKPGHPEFETARLLVPPNGLSPLHAGEPGQPGCYHAFCVADFNGDSRLDLVLGDRFHKRVEVSPAERESPPSNKERSDGLYEQLHDLRDGPTGETYSERVDRYRKMLHVWQEYETVRLAGNSKSGECVEYTGHLWLFERIGVKTP